MGNFSSNGGANVDRRTNLSNSDVAVKTSAGFVYGVDLQNATAADCFIQFYDDATANVSVGTTTPTLSLWIPPSGGRDTQFDPPLRFSTAITIAATTTAGGSTAPASSPITNIFYS